MENLTDYQKSERDAGLITVINIGVAQLDREHLSKAAKDMRNAASRADSAAALISNYDPEQTKLMDLQAKTIETLVQYANLVDQCTQAKQKIEANKATRQKINSIFGF